MHGEIFGPYPVSRLRVLAGFTKQTMISIVGSDKWAPAYRVLNLKTEDPPLSMSFSLADYVEPKTYQSVRTYDFKATHKKKRSIWRLALTMIVMVATGIGVARSYPPLWVTVKAATFYESTKAIQRIPEPYREWIQRLQLVLARPHLAGAHLMKWKEFSLKKKLHRVPASSPRKVTLVPRTSHTPKLIAHHVS